MNFSMAGSNRIVNSNLMHDYVTYFGNFILAAVAHYFALKSLNMAAGRRGLVRSPRQLIRLLITILGILLYDFAFFVTLVVMSIESWESLFPTPKDAIYLNKQASLFQSLQNATPVAMTIMWFSFMALMMLAFWGSKGVGARRFCATLSFKENPNKNRSPRESPQGE